MYHPNLIVSKSKIDVNQQIYQMINKLDDLHPLEFRIIFGLTHEEAADELCIEPQTMRSYTQKNPSRRVRKLAATATKTKIINGYPLKTPELLLKAILACQV